MLRDELLVELRFTAKKMKEEQDPRRKMFFFSTVFAATNRALNMDFDKELLFVSVVSQSCYETILLRVEQMFRGHDNIVPLPQGFFEGLISSVEGLADAVERGKGFDEVLMNMALLSYVTTGNGSYLFERGKLQLPAK
jgi:hypothetical protein